MFKHIFSENKFNNFLSISIYQMYNCLLVSLFLFCYKNPIVSNYKALKTYYYYYLIELDPPIIKQKNKQTQSLYFELTCIVNFFLLLFQ